MILKTIEREREQQDNNEVEWGREFNHKRGDDLKEGIRKRHEETHIPG